MALNFQLQFAGIPFVSDVAVIVRLPSVTSHNFEPEHSTSTVKQQPETDLISELNRVIPFQYLSEYAPPTNFTSRVTDSLAVQWPMSHNPSQTIRIGDWYYPTNASRWSVFRGLATTSMVKEMLRATQGGNAATFLMKAEPSSPFLQGTRTNSVVQNLRNQNNIPTDDIWKLQTQMYMLPPRPLAEHGSKYDGLYLVTLVDQRYYWQNTPIALKVTAGMTWNQLINQIGSVLGLGDTYGDSIDIPASLGYTGPEPDSQFWTSEGDAALFLDAAAYNVGDVAVRWFNGTIKFVHPMESQTIAKDNRGIATKVVRIAGGEIFQSGGTWVDQTYARNAVVPATVRVSFPKYVYGSDPVPHFVNPRYQNPRPSAWMEDSYGDVFSVNVPIASGNRVYLANPFLQDPTPNSGLIGVSGDVYSIYDTAKALYSTEASSVSGSSPDNVSGLTTLSLQLAADYWNWQAAEALDEVYPGTYAWTPEGFHDILWTYSERSRLASTRVMRAEWNQSIRFMQHATPPLSGYSPSPAGVGGKSVAQSWRDSFSGSISTTLSATLSSGGVTASFSSISYFPTQNRWRGRIDNENILFEGTSGGTSVGIVYRGIDGTIQTSHDNGSTISQLAPHTTYGVNLLTTEKMGFVFPQDWTSGGIQGANIIPQTQSVKVFSSRYVNIGGLNYYSGQVNSFYPNTGFSTQEYVWVADRNNNPLVPGKIYDGQFGGFSHQTPKASPVYLVTESLPNTQSFPPTSGQITSGLIPNCNPIYVTESNTYCCASGGFKVYERQVFIGMVLGCLQKVPANWYLAMSCGCVDYPRWPPDPCIPGECQSCDDPPALWTIPVEGFTGVCEVFNKPDGWLLSPAGNCTWENTGLSTPGTADVTIRLTIAGTAVLVQMYYGEEDNPLATSSFQGTITTPNCCANTRLEQITCDCGGEAGGDGDDCVACSSTPSSILVVLSGFTGGFGVFEGTYTFEQNAASPCLWQPPAGVISPTLTMALIANFGGWTLQLTDTSTNPATVAVYGAGPFDGACCTLTVLGIKSGAFSPTGGVAPPTVEITPNCNAEAGGCPDYIDASPYCCNSDEPICDPIPCTTCDDPENAPISWTFSLNGFTGGCETFNGTWTVYQNPDGCSWSYYHEDGTTLTVDFLVGDTIRLTVFRTNEDIANSAVFYGDFNGDCCSQVSVTLQDNTTCGGDSPVTLTPYCCDDSPPSDDPWWCVEVGEEQICTQSATEPAGSVGGEFESEEECENNCGQWWCLNGTCVRATSQPEGSTGPYDSQGECEANCEDVPPVPVTCTDWSGQEIIATITTTGNCSCVASPVTFIWAEHPTYDLWTGTISSDGCGSPSSVALSCLNDVWTLTGTNLSVGTPATSAEDGEVIFPALDGSGICDGGGTVQITFTLA